MSDYKTHKTYRNVEPGVHVTILGEVTKQSSSTRYVFGSVEIDGTIYPVMFSTLGHLSSSECHPNVTKRCANINLNRLENALKSFDVTPVVGTVYQYGDNAIATILSYISTENRYLGVILDKSGKSKPMYFTDKGRSVDTSTRDLQRTAHAGSPLIEGLRSRSPTEAQAALQGLFTGMGPTEARNLRDAISRL